MKVQKALRDNFFPLSFQGATIKADEATGRILIARVMHGGAADRSGLISVGDEVIEVNGINVEGKTPNDVLKILVSHVFDRLQARIIVLTVEKCVKALI